MKNSPTEPITVPSRGTVSPSVSSIYSRVHFLIKKVPKRSKIEFLNCSIILDSSGWPNVTLLFALFLVRVVSVVIIYPKEYLTILDPKACNQVRTHALMYLVKFMSSGCFLRNIILSWRTSTSGLGNSGKSNLINLSALSSTLRNNIREKDFFTIASYPKIYAETMYATSSVAVGVILKNPVDCPMSK